MAKRDLSALTQKATAEGLKVTTSQDRNITKSHKLKNNQANRETYYIPKELHTQLKIKAVTDGCSPSDLVVAALEDYLERQSAG